MKVRSVVLLLVVSVFAFLLTACGTQSSTSGSSPSTQSKKMVFAISFPATTVPYMQGNIAEAQAWAKKHPNVDLVITDSRLDSSKQISDMEDFIARKVTAIIVLANQSPTLIPVLQKAKAAGIPVVAVDRTIPDASLYDSYVGSNDVQIGQMDAQFLVKRLNGQGKIAILEGVPGSTPAVDRKKGFMDVIKQYPGIKVVSDQVANWQRVQAVSVMENVIEAHPDINGLYCENDEMSLGAIQVLKQAGKKGVVVVSGDGEKQGIKAVMDGDIAYTVKKSLEFPLACQVALKIVEGQSVEKQNIVPSIGIDSSNAKQYYNPNSVF